VIHQDIKPQNILLSEDNRVKLSDFGLRQVFIQEELANDSPCYKSPEVLEGKPYSKSSDVWALGCVLYELCYFEVTLKHIIESL